MLGWLHQTCVSERDLVESILSIKSDSVGKRHTGSKGVLTAGDDVLFSILDRNLERTCRPFKVRIEQVLVSQPGAITSYRIANTLQFYTVTISQVIGKNSKLSETIKDCTDMSFKIFLDVLRQYGSKVQSSKEAPGRDLLPPPVIKESLLQLKELMSSYEANLLEGDENSYDFSQVLGTLLDPVLELCKTGASLLPVLEGCIYQLNCLRYIQTLLLPYSFTRDRLQSIEEEVVSFRGLLTKETYSLLLQQSGLVSVVKTLESNADKVPLSLVAGIDQRTIAEAMSRLDTFLRDVGFDVTSRLSRMSSSQDTKHVIDKSLREFSDSYSKLYEKVMDPGNKYEFPATLMTRSIDEIETLLDVPKV